MAPRRSTEGLLARVNFPLYSVEMLTSRHVLVAGGGGSSKTGVANGFVSIILIFLYYLSFQNLLKILYFNRKFMKYIIMVSNLLLKKSFAMKLEQM